VFILVTVLTIHCKNWPCWSHEYTQEVEGDRSSYVVLTGNSIIILVLYYILFRMSVCFCCAWCRFSVL